VIIFEKFSEPTISSLKFFSRMGKEKFTLAEIQVQSFVTSLDQTEMEKVKGGYMTIKGRRVSYRTRWTAVDTRVDAVEAFAMPGHQTVG